MKNIFRTGAASAAIVMALGMGSAVQAAEASADAKVEVLKPLSLEKTADMDFGAVAVNGSGTATLDFDADGAGELTCSADIVCVGTSNLAGFRVFGGSAGRTVGVTLPAAIDLVHSAPADPANPTNAEVIELGGYTTNADATNTFDTDGTTILSTSYSVDLGALGDADEGEATFDLGGTISFDGSEIAGEYTGTFTVSVEYI